MPDSAWLTDMRLENDTLWIDGYARNAPELVGILAQSPLLSGVTLSFPVVREEARASERFQIRMKIETAGASGHRQAGGSMSLLRPRSIASRALALTLLVGGLAMFWLFAVAPIKTWYDDNDQAINDGIRAHSILKSVAAEGRQARPDLSPDSLERYRGDFLAGAEDPIIVAELQTRLSSRSRPARARLNSAQALQPKAKDGLDYLGLRLQFRAEMKSVQEILHAIETSTPLAFHRARGPAARRTQRSRSRQRRRQRGTDERRDRHLRRQVAGCCRCQLMGAKAR